MAIFITTLTRCNKPDEKFLQSSDKPEQPEKKYYQRRHPIDG
jgi:hypothetical protein